MELRFLGQTYSASSIRVKTTPSKYNARFLGRMYSPRLPIKPVKSQLGLKKYRGIPYES